MDYKNYKDLISKLPEKEHGVPTKRAIWKKYEIENQWLTNYNNIIFEEKKEKIITCGELLEFFENRSDVNLFLLLVIYWGYPNGMRGNIFENIIEKGNWKKLCEIVSLLQINPKIDNFESYFAENVKQIRGMGLSTFSKILHFLKVEVEGNFAAILDIQIIEVLKNSAFREIEFEKLNYDNGVKYYTLFLKFINTKANDFQVTIGQFEMFMFIFGRILN